MNTMQIKRYAATTLLVAGAIAATYGVMTIRELRAGNERLKDEAIKLELQVIQLQERKVELQAEGERLK